MRYYKHYISCKYFGTRGRIWFFENPTKAVMPWQSNIKFTTRFPHSYCRDEYLKGKNHHSGESCAHVCVIHREGFTGIH